MYPSLKKKKPQTEVWKLSDGSVIKRVGNHVYINLATKTQIVTYSQFNLLRRHVLLATGRGSPNASIIAPNALGGKGTVMFGVLNYVNRWPTVSPPNGDGFGSLGVSFGDPYKYVGAVIGYNQNSFGLHNDPFAANGGLGVRLNRYITPLTAIAVGAGNIAGWGSNATISRSYYVAVTQAAFLLVPISINVGLGTGGFNNPIVATHNDNNAQPFTTVGIGLLPNLTALFDWTARQVNLGASYTILNFRKFPIYIGLYGMNLANYDGSKDYFQATAGVSYQFSQ